MPCDTVLSPQQTAEQRERQIKESLQRLEDQLRSKIAKVTIGPNGAVAFTGWRDRGDVSDVCAFRRLTSENSWELRQAVATAEATAGRKVSQAAVASGEHFHEGSGWHKGHDE